MNRLIIISSIFLILSPAPSLSAQNLENVKRFNDVYSVNDTLSWAVGDSGLVVKFTRDIQSIENISIVPPNNQKDFNFNGVYFDDEMTGSMVGATNSGKNKGIGVVLKTTDGGLNWFAKYPAPSTIGPFHKIYFKGKYCGIIVAEEYLLRTTNRGVTWFIMKMESSSDIEWILDNLRK